MGYAAKLGGSSNGAVNTPWSGSVTSTSGWSGIISYQLPTAGYHFLYCPHSGGYTYGNGTDGHDIHCGEFYSTYTYRATTTVNAYWDFGNYIMYAWYNKKPELFTARVYKGYTVNISLLCYLI